jgi:2-polyprenyl-3-methyl-5-hydroxy-6-metoxy-1,4-benzoquinol methylase/thioredoxin-like negative regulator of GroEL
MNPNEDLYSDASSSLRTISNFELGLYDGPDVSGHHPRSTLDPEEQFYVNLFVNDPRWSTPHPNEDESARWAKISVFLKQITEGQFSTKRLRLLEVGCGRGWLTNLASSFGECEGVEPVASVVRQARSLFPNLRFKVGTAETILTDSGFVPYDLVLASEVIEHISSEEKSSFVQSLFRLLKPGGHVVITTPRAEVMEEWTRLVGDPSQPIEEWLHEPELCKLFLNQAFLIAGHERVLFDTKSRQFLIGQDSVGGAVLPIYQVWLFQRPFALVQSTNCPSVIGEIVKPASAPSLEQLLSKAQDLLQRGDLAGSRKCLEASLALAPADDMICESLGNVCYQTCDFEAAFKHYVRLCQLREASAAAWLKLAHAAVRSNRVEDFEKAMARTLELEPEQRDALKFLADLNFQNGSFADAAGVYSRILRRTASDIEVLLALGTCWWKLGQVRQAATVYQTILQIEPGHSLAAENLCFIQTQCVAATSDQHACR